ncbi:MAG: hypothetical protein WC996_10395 [Peptostreptococcales bacterium]
MSDINRNKLLNLAKDLGISDLTSENIKRVEEVAKKYDKSQEKEMLEELKNLKSTLFKDKASFEKQLKIINEIRPMLNKEQRSKLDAVLNLLMKE